jgi:SNF2 family DNA or RNA helicase
MQDYAYKTTPFKHQDEFVNRTWSLPVRGLFWEQGTGKTKSIIDTAALLYERGGIDAVLVVAPNGVHRNWINDEIPIHMPERVRNRMLAYHYDSSKAPTQKAQRNLDQVMEWNGLAFLAISYNGFMTDRGKKTIKKFLTRRKCLYVLDESHHIKAPGIKRTKTIVASGAYAPYRRILTGTPVAEGPFGAYAQVRFLDPGFWIPHGLGSYAAFKAYFGVWKTREETRQKLGYDPGYDQLLSYRNLDELQRLLRSISDRVTKEDAGLDLPEKLYSKRYFEMTTLQRRTYETLKETYVAELRDGTLLEADLAIVRLLRLQQITCGYAQTDAKEPMRLVDKSNPRLDLLIEEILPSLGHKAIIWCRFRHDIDQIMAALGPIAVRYDGQVTDDQAEKAKNAFQTGDAQFFVANISKGKEGLTLHAAKTVIYYSNSFKLLERMQSEDRAHRIGLKHPVHYIDIIAPNTVDVQIHRALRDKQNIQALIIGDGLREWL